MVLQEVRNFLLRIILAIYKSLYLVYDMVNLLFSNAIGYFINPENKSPKLIELESDDEDN